MTHPARDLLTTTTAELAPDPQSNPLVPRIADGTAPRPALAGLALEQTWVIPADRRAAPGGTLRDDRPGGGGLLQDTRGGRGAGG